MGLTYGVRPEILLSKAAQDASAGRIAWNRACSWCVRSPYLRSLGARLLFRPTMWLGGNGCLGSLKRTQRTALYGDGRRSDRVRALWFRGCGAGRAVKVAAALLSAGLPCRWHGR